MAKQQQPPISQKELEMMLENAPSLTGKFQCAYATDQSIDGVHNVRVTLNPETGENLDGSGTGNESWSANATPSGVISMLITSADKQSFFEVGKHYAISITPIDQPADSVQS